MSAGGFSDVIDGFIKGVLRGFFGSPAISRR
jgi:hypothetical protein